jgi:hypothetical protein
MSAAVGVPTHLGRLPPHADGCSWRAGAVRHGLGHALAWPAGMENNNGLVMK